MRRIRGWGAAAAVLAVLMGLAVAFLAGPASADGPTPSPSTSTNVAKAKKACAKVPKATAKVNKALTRIKAGAGTKGSIAWLNAKATKADTDGKTALADAYRAKAKIRTDRITVLTDRKTALTQAAAWCKSAGY